MYLGIACAFGPISIAILSPTRQLVVEVSVAPTYDSTENLILEIEKLLRQHNLNWASLGGVGITAGPGGYTALRMGVTLAKTIGYVARIPVIPINTLEAIAFCWKALDRVIFATIPARKNELNLALFGTAHDSVTRLSHDFSKNTPEMLTTWMRIQGPFAIAGDLPATVMSELADQAHIRLIPTHISGQTVATMAKTAIDQQHTPDLNQIIPIYSHQPNLGTIKKR